MFCSNQCLDVGSRQLIKFNTLNFRFENFPSDYLQNLLKALDISDNLQDLEAIYTDPKSTSVFDYDLSEPKSPQTKRNMLKCAASLRKRDQDNSSVDYSILKTLASVSRISNSAVCEFITRQGAINECNNLGVQVKEDVQGTALFLFASLLNHSCDPSIDTFYIDSSAAFVINRPVRVGEQLFLNYRQNFTYMAKTERQNELKLYQFKCECVACVSNYPLFGDLPRFDQNFTSPMFHETGTVKESIEEAKQNFEYITENIKHHPSMETCLAMSRCVQLLADISDKTYCPF
jgi:SET domain